MQSPNTAVRRSILVVEDHDLSASLIMELLACAAKGPHLHRAASASAGVTEYIRLRPTLLVVDIGLPDASGLEVTRRIAALNPLAPVVIFSGQDSAVMREGAAAAGARAFVSKNNPGELLDVVNCLLGSAPHVQNSLHNSPECPTDGAGPSA
jgi:DNA-binding NarL/FixJ family response regulator